MLDKPMLTFPERETYELPLRMRRAAVSILANTAGGFRRRGNGHKPCFLNRAGGRGRKSYTSSGGAAPLSATLEEISRLLRAGRARILTSGS